MKVIKEKTLACEFGSDSGKKTGRKISLKVNRSLLPMDVLFQLIVGAKLEVKLEARDGDAEQATLPGTESEVFKLEAPAECRSFKTNLDQYSFALDFGDDIDAGKLSQFGFRCGTVKLQRIGNAKEDDPNGDNRSEG